MPTPPKKPGKLTPTQRQKILDRLEQGESVAPLGREFGVTPSAIYDLRKRYREHGASVIEGRDRRPNPKLKKIHEDYLRQIFTTSSPPDLDPAVPDKGNATKAQAVIRRKFGFNPSAEECARVLKELDLSHILHPSSFVPYVDSTPTGFTVWAESSAAKQLARRERTYLRKREKIDVPKHPGPPALANRERWATLRLFQIDDPILLNSRELAQALDKISATKPRRRNPRP